MNIILYILKKYKFNCQTCRLLGMSAMLILFSTGTSVAQYSYFNEIYIHDHNTYEITRSIELIEDGYTTASQSLFNDNHCLIFRKFDFDGNLELQKFHEFPSKIISIGRNDGFQKDPNSDGYFMTFSTSHVGETVDLAIGVLIYIDSDLNIIWEKKYYLYDDRSLVLERLLVKEDHIVLHGVLSNGQYDQVVLKSDLEGNLLSHFVLDFDSEDSDQSFDMDLIGNDFLLSGGRLFVDENSLMTRVDQNGNVIWQLFLDESSLNEYPFSSELIDNNYILSARAIDLHTLDSDSPDSQIEFVRINSETGEYEILESMHQGKSVRISNFRKFEDDFILFWSEKKPNTGRAAYASIVDKNGNELKRSQYMPGTDEMVINGLSDFVIAPDDSRIFVGWHGILDSNGTQTWLLKVDPCGDTEWLGCEPHSEPNVIFDTEYRLYPNPCRNSMTLEQDPFVQLSSIELYNSQGQLSKSFDINPEFTQSKLDLSELPRGMYTAVMKSVFDKVYIEKIVMY